VFWLVIVSVLVLGEVLESGARQVVCPKDGLLRVVSVLCNEDVIDQSCPSLIPRWFKVTAERDCRENSSELRQTQNGGRDAFS
jgi:hypothetical protein